MTDQPLAVCVTPTYGRLHLLKEMLWCWKNQTYRNKKLIILNDQERLNLTCNVPGVIIINYEPRFPALGAKRNYLATQIPQDAAYVLPMDDDDLFFPTYIERFVTALEQHPDVDRVKNKINYLCINNQFHSVNRQPGYYGASCFRADFIRKALMHPDYVMGEDTEMMERYGVKTYEIDDGTSTFVYRTGMGIVHASGHGIETVGDPEAQRRIHERIAETSVQFKEYTQIQLIPEMGYNAAELYRDVFNLTWRTN